MRSFPHSRFHPYLSPRVLADVRTLVANADALLRDVRAQEVITARVLAEFEAFKAKYLRLGDHSIEGSHISAIPLYNETSIALDKVDFVRSLTPRIRDREDAFVFGADGVTVQSQICNSAPGGGFALPVLMEGLALPSPAPRPVGAQFHELQVTVTMARQTTQIDPVVLDHLMNAGVPSEKQVSSALQPNLRLANSVCLRQMGAIVGMANEVYDNCLMYAKLVHYAILLELVAATPDAQVQAIDLPAEAPIQWINLDDANLNFNVFQDAIYNKRIVLFYGEDVGVADVPALLWLALGNRRLEPEAAHHAPEGVYTNWPTIPITLLGRGAAPVFPPAAVLPASSLLGLAFKLATKRAEWDDLMRGIYVAFDLIGVRYQGVEGRIGPIKTDLSPRDVMLPAVADYNFIYRILHVYPTSKDESRSECEAFLQLPSMDRLRLAALYTAAYSSFVTTVLYGVNVNTALLQNWCTGGLVPAIANPIFMSGFNMPTASQPPVDAHVVSQAKRGFRVFLGAGVPGHLYAGIEWLGGFGSIPYADMSYNNQIPDITPRNFTPLCIDNWLLVRPIEWGIVGPCPTMSLSKEVILRGLLARQGWYAQLGSSEYNNLAKSGTPITTATYGVTALNAILQSLVVMVQPVIQRQSCQWIPGNPSVSWELPQPIPAAQLIFHLPLRCFDPCSVMTFDFAHNAVMAPCLMAGDIGAGNIRALFNYQGQRQEGAGIALGTMEPEPNIADQAPVMELGSLALFGSSAPMRQDQPTAPAKGHDPDGGDTGSVAVVNPM